LFGTDMVDWAADLGLWDDIPSIIFQQSQGLNLKERSCPSTADNVGASYWCPGTFEV